LQTVRGIGFFGVAVPEVFLFKRNGGELGIGADSANRHKLFDALKPGLVNELHAHHQIVVEKFAGLLAVGADAADLGCQMDDDIRLGSVDHADDVRFANQVVFGILRHENLARAVLLEPADKVRA
jgi:hypothetical protein